MNVWDQVLEFFGRVPPAVWVAAVVSNLILTAATWSVPRRRLRRAGDRLANPELVAGRRRRDTALTVAALVPAALFLTMVVAGSMHGLVAFGLNVLGWHDGWEYLVPATLDGVSVAFAFLAFRAVRRGKAPDRCYRAVWGAAGASASINFSYEYSQSGNLLAGGYVGLLSVLGMVMFHEFLSQFEDGTDYRIRRENPKFGLRWLTWPSNTLLAAIAWRNHPPAEGTPGTVAAAVANLNRVREAKRAGRARSPIHAAPTAPARAPAAPLAVRPGPEPAAAGGDRPPAYIRDADGQPLRPRVNYRSELVFVRAFYEDLARWAADDPARWASWVAPCPIKAAECLQKKFQSRVKSRMDQRTRTQLPLLPALLRAVEQQRKDAEQRLSMARDTAAGGRFTVAGLELERCRSGESGRVYATDMATGKRRNLTHEEEAAFWSWATVEVLRHSGIRIEEMLELTHHSFIAYTLPTTGEVVPMLQVAPSKTDAERLLPID